jgi:hypothetical protein
MGSKFLFRQFFADQKIPEGRNFSSEFADEVL